MTTNCAMTDTASEHYGILVMDALVKTIEQIFGNKANFSLLCGWPKNGDIKLHIGYVPGGSYKNIFDDITVYTKDNDTIKALNTVIAETKTLINIIYGTTNYSLGVFSAQSNLWLTGISKYEILFKESFTARQKLCTCTR